MMRFFHPPSAGRKLQRKSGPPALLLGSSSDVPEDIDAPLRYFPGKALHADFWRDGVRPSGFKYPSGREARVIVPILGMCGVGRTCVSNYVSFRSIDESEGLAKYTDSSKMGTGVGKSNRAARLDLELSVTTVMVSSIRLPLSRYHRGANLTAS
jgi:hypothetical protein